MILTKLADEWLAIWMTTAVAIFCVATGQTLKLVLSKSDTAPTVCGD